MKNQKFDSGFVPFVDCAIPGRDGILKLQGAPEDMGHRIQANIGRPAEGKKGKHDMKHSKKLISLLMAAALTLSLTACNSNAGTNPPASGTPSGGTTASNPPAQGGDTAPLTIDQVWPAGTTVTIDVPAKAGGGTDIATRYLTQALSEVVPGVNFVVNNYDTTEVGREHMKNAEPDGLTLLVHHGGMILEYLSGSTNVNAKEDYKAVGVVNRGGPQAIIVRPDAPYSTLQELGDYIKANPGEVVIGCTLGGASQAALYAIIDALGEGYTEMVNWVQCGSEADKLTQTASGSIDIANCSINNAQGYEADGRLKVLSTSCPTGTTLADLEALVGIKLGDNYAPCPEQGVDAVYDSSYYMWAPAGTPDNICQAINEAIMKATEVQSFIDGNKQMATFVEANDFASTQKIFTDEWAAMEVLAEGMGTKIR